MWCARWSIGVCLLATAGLLILGLEELSFMSGLLWRVWKSTTDSLGTTSLAVALTVGIFVAVLFIKLKRYGWAEMKARLKENITDGLILTIIAWVLLVSYHLFYRVPSDIYKQAEGTPSPRKEGVPDLPPPPFAYHKTPVPVLIPSVPTAEEIAGEVARRLPTQDRRLTTEAAIFMQGALRGSQCDITVGVLGMGGEPEILASQLFQTAKDAGCETKGIYHGIGFDPFYGLQVQRALVGFDPNQVQIISRALTISGIEHRELIGLNLRNNQIYLYVGFKP